MLGLALVFPLIAKFTMPNYVGYLLSGVLAWGFISNACLIGGDCYLMSEGFIRNVYLPRLLLPIVFVTTEAVTLFIGSVALLTIGWALDLGVLFRPFTLVAAIILTYLFCIGTVLGLSVALVYFRDLKNITGVALQSLFYLSAIVYPVSVLPEEYQALMEFNPFFQFIRLFHLAIYGGGNLWGALGTASATVVLFLGAGLFVNVRYAKYVIFRL
jgi:ABC-type polysaccharide/polyol phosphate export permease